MHLSPFQEKIVRHVPESPKVISDVQLIKLVFGERWEREWDKRQGMRSGFVRSINKLCDKKLLFAYELEGKLYIRKRKKFPKRSDRE